MDIRNRHALKQYAAARLAEQTYSPRRLALIHTAVASVFLLVLSALNYFLSQQVDSAVGLSGMGLRSILQTAQMVLQYAANIAMPFWKIGFLFTAICMARGKQMQPHALTEGFRRFGPVLRLMLLRGLVYGALGLACIYLSSILYTFTPAAQKMMAYLIPFVESGTDMLQLQTALLEMPLEQLTSLIWPVFVIFGVVYGLVAAAMFYRFRLADYLIMDKPGTGALAALTLSCRLTRKNCFALLRLDLSFWWYYALHLVTVLLCYLDVLLLYFAIPLPMDAASASFLTYILGLGAQLLLFTYAGSHLHTTWAAAYDALLQQHTEKPQPNSVSKNLPWDDYAPK